MGKMKRVILIDSVNSGWRKPKTVPMDAEWKSRLQRMVANAMSSMEISDRHLHLDLRKKLLSFGGEEVCISYNDSDTLKILSYGKVWRGTKAVMNKGIPCRCHQNAAALFDMNPKRFRVATGWALSRDGVWREHSWGVDKNIPEETDGSHIVETTEKRLAYCGVVLNETACKRWVSKNL